MVTSAIDWINQQLANYQADEFGWYLDKQTGYVWFNYRLGESTSYASYRDWFNSLDISCRSAVAQTIEQVQDDRQARYCQFSHNDDCWFRMRVNMVDDAPGDGVLHGDVVCLNRPSDNSDQLLMQSGNGLLSCPMFRSFFIQAVQNNTIHEEPMVLMSLYVDDQSESDRLETVAQVLRDTLRRRDLVGYFRQQELLVLLNGVTAGNAQIVANKILEHLSADEVLDGVTLGWANFPSDGDNVDTLLEQRYIHQLPKN